MDCHLNPDNIGGHKIRFFTAQSGRIVLHCEIRVMGKDLQATLTGGMEHIGAIAVADSGSGAPGPGMVQLMALQLPGHYDIYPARLLASILAHKLHRNVAVSCGIHYNAITRKETADVMRLTRLLGNRIGKLLQREQSC